MTIKLTTPFNHITNFDTTSDSNTLNNDNQINNNLCKSRKMLLGNQKIKNL